MVVVADAALYLGHIAWIEQQQIALDNVRGGFSFIVKQGIVTGFFPSSELNRTADWRLTDEQLTAVLSLLPLAPDFKLY